MKKRSRITFFAFIICTVLQPVLHADDLKNQFIELYSNNKIDAEKSYEVPALFDAGGRRIRWKTVFQTGAPSPIYESWRVKQTSEDSKQQLHLAFKSDVSIGTVLAFANDIVDSKFEIKGEQIQSTTPAGIVVAPVKAPISSIDLYSTYLQNKILANWASRKNVSADKLLSYQFSIATLYAIKEQRENIAPAASVRISGKSFRHRRENEERVRNKATSLNDLSTHHYWRSQKLKDDETAKAELHFPKAVIAREIGLYIGNYLFNEMPASVKITAIDVNNEYFEVGEFNGFSSHTHTGKHFYLLKNDKPERKIKTLKFSCKAQKDVVSLHEIIVLGAPEDNPGLSRNQSDVFEKKIVIKSNGNKVASAVIRDNTGKTIKNLQPSKVTEKGEFIFSWDGTNNSGNLVTPGEYNMHGITVDDLHALYESTPYSPVATPWVTPSRRGGWLSDHHYASTIERIGDDLWVGAVSAESGDTIMQLDPEGNKLWGVRWLNLAGAKFIRSANNKVYVAAVGGWIGRKISITEITPDSKVFKTILSMPITDKLLGFPATPANKKRVKAEVLKGSTLTGFAVKDNMIALAFAGINTIELYDFKGDKIREIKTDNPKGMRFDERGDLYFISNNKIIKEDQNSNALEEVAIAGLKGPEDFIINAERIIIADRGDNCVKVFNTSGKLLQKIGKGDRHPGLYIPEILSKPISVAIDSKNQLWVSEATKLPKRISVWNLDSGKLIHEYLGPAKYEAGGWLDPRDSSVYYAEGMTFKYNGKKWNLQAIYDDFNSPTNNLLKRKSHLTSSVPERAILCRDKLFMASDRHWANKKIWFGIMGQDKILKPYAAIGSYTSIITNFNERPAEWNNDPKSFTFLWVDNDSDGEMQWEELQFTKAVFKTFEWSTRMSETLDFNFALNANEFYQLSPEWKEGLPHYDLAKRKQIIKLPKQRVISVSSLSKNRLLLNTNPLTCIDVNTGKTLWTYSNNFPSNGHDSNLPKSGEIQHTLNIEGLVTVPSIGEDVFMLNGNKGLRYLFTCDGIYIGKLFNDVRLALPLSVETVNPGDDLVDYSLMDEAFNGSFARYPDNKIRFSGGKNHSSIYEITGLDTLKKFQQEITFSKSDWEKALQEQKDLKAKELNSRLENPPVIASLSKAIRFSGDERLWKHIPKQEVGGEQNMRFSYRLGKDKEHFYGAFKVKDSSPFVNTGLDWKMLFKSGDSINIELGLTKSSKVSAQDCRILIAPLKKDGKIKPVAVLYHYNAPLPPNTEPIIFGSPVGKVQVNKLKIITTAEVKVTRGNGGYFLEFKIPLKEIPSMSGDPNQIFGDVGIIFSDERGRINQYNLFRYSPVKGVTADVPSEIRLSPQYWKEFKIK